MSGRDEYCFPIKTRQNYGTARIAGRRHAKENQGGGYSGWMQLVRELFKSDIYKRSQGRLVRQFTCLAIWAAFGLAAWRVFRRC